jgi:hypothetical protein
MASKLSNYPFTPRQIATDSIPQRHRHETLKSRLLGVHHNAVRQSKGCKFNLQNIKTNYKAFKI